MKKKNPVKTKKARQKPPSAKLFTSYPRSHVLIYNASLILHFFLAAYAIVVGYDFFWFKYLFGLFYLLFAFIHAYVILPLAICPHCPYFTLENACCVSGLNIVSVMITTKGSGKNFKTRAQSFSSYDSVFWLSILLPLPLVLPAFIINFSIKLLIACMLLLASIAFRLFYLIPNISCAHCKAKTKCSHYRKMKAYLSLIKKR
jgi:hypothetical protein